MAEVQIISAPWCKRCQTIKPEIEAHSVITGVSLTILDYDEMEESDPIKLAVKSLPTMRLRIGDSWTVYTADSLASLKEQMTAASLSVVTGSDF